MSKISAPSVKTLMDRLNLERDVATVARAIMKGEIKRDQICDMLPKTGAWERSCYNSPTIQEVKMEALNELLGGYGVEAIIEADADFRDAPAYTYVNMGDTYTATIVRARGGRYMATDWGSIVERAREGRFA